VTDRRVSVRPVSHDRWLVSYADFITLLFAFFAVMYAVSSVDKGKLETVAKGLRVAFENTAVRPPNDGDGILPGGRRLFDDHAEAMARVQAAILRTLGDEVRTNRLTLTVDRRGVILSVPEAGTFATGNDELSDEARELLAEIATTLAWFNNAVRVEGHSDDVPIRTTRFQSNWDLSAARARRVVEFLIQRGVEPERLSATGYAEFQPRVPNDSDEARAVNRRIDLVIANVDAAGERRALEDGAR
jgi:chemotaxis protein MotB